MYPEEIWIFGMLGVMMAIVLVLYYVSVRATGKRLPEEANLKPLFTTRIWIGPRYQWRENDPKESRFSIYPDFVVIHSEKRGHLHRREDLTFTAEHLLLAKWVHMKDRKTGFDSDVNGHGEAIIAALRQGGYTVQTTGSAVVT